MLRTLQTNLTGGAISSDAKDRLDLQVWKNSVRRAENVSIKPQGGATRRHGTTIVRDLTDLVNLDYQVEAFVFSQNQSYVCLFSHGRIDIFDRVTRSLVQSHAGQPWSAAMVAARELVVVQSFDTMFVFHKDFETRQIVRTGATTFSIGVIQWGFLDTGSGNIPRMPMQKFYTGITHMRGLTVGPGAIGLQTNFDLFRAGHIGTWMLLYNVPVYITAITDGLNASASASAALPNTAGTVDWQEQAFSAVRGYARCATLHEQRLFIGGGRDTPNTIWGSTTYDPLNFWLGSGQPTDAIKFIAAQDRVAEIKRMVSFRHLQLYTADGEFYAPSPQNGALTPANFSLRQQSAYGIANADAKRFDQTSIFISRTANSIREFVYDDVQQSYSSDALTFMAKDYIRNPVELDVAIETETAQEALAIVTNGDGTLAILSKVRRENVGGWMLWSMTGGTFKSIGVIEREIWAITEHHAKRWLVVFDKNYRLDFAKKLAAGSPATSWGPFPNHIGMVVDALSGDLYLGQYTVDPAGYIVVDTPISEIEIGHSYIPLIQPLVQEVQMPDGVSWGVPKRNVSVTIQLIDTLVGPDQQRPHPDGQRRRGPVDRARPLHRQVQGVAAGCQRRAGTGHHRAAAAALQRHHHPDRGRGMSFQIAMMAGMAAMTVASAAQQASAAGAAGARAKAGVGEAKRQAEMEHFFSGLGGEVRQGAAMVQAAQTDVTAAEVGIQTEQRELARRREIGRLVAGQRHRHGRPRRYRHRPGFAGRDRPRQPRAGRGGYLQHQDDGRERQAAALLPQEQFRARGDGREAALDLRRHGSRG